MVTIMYKILIIEDEPSISRMYKFILEEAGHTAIIARNGIEGLDLAKKSLPDLILLDIKMPKMPGDEVLARIRSTGWGNEIPVIILSNTSRSEVSDSLEELGISRYVIKANYTPSQVVAMMKEVLGREVKS